MTDYYGMKRCRFCAWWLRGTRPDINDAEYICAHLGPYHKQKPMDSCRRFYNGGVLPEPAVDLEVANA